jgi:hypothetical protein
MVAGALGAVVLPMAAPVFGKKLKGNDALHSRRIDYYFKNRVDEGCFGKFCHERGPRAVDRQAVIRLNL